MQKDHRKTQNHNQENNQQNYQPEDQEMTFGRRLFSSHPDAGVSWQQKKTHTVVKPSVLDDLNRWCNRKYCTKREHADRGGGPGLSGRPSPVE